MQGVVDGHAVLVRRSALLEQWSQPLPPSLAGAKTAAEEQGRPAIAVAWDGEARAVLVVADTIKPTSAQAIAHLRALGLTPVLLTGDNTAGDLRAAADAIRLSRRTLGTIKANLSGPSPTTWPPCRWPRPACSTR